ERSNLVVEMARFLQSSNTREELFSIVGRFGPRLFPRFSGALCIIDATKNLIEIAAGWGDNTAFEPVFSSEDCWALRDGRMHVVQNATAGLGCAHVAARTGAQLCMPMMAQSETLGILHLHSKNFCPSGETFPPSELRLTQRMA